MGKITAVFVSVLTFSLFYYISTILADFSLGFELPIYGWVQVSQPFAGLEQPTLIVGGLLSAIMLILLWSKGSRKVEP